MIGSFQLRVPILLPTGTKFKLKKVQYLSLWKEDSGEGASGRSGAAWVSSGGPSTGRAPASCSWLGAEPVLGQRLLASSAPDRAVCCNRAALFYNFSFGIWVIFSCACCILSSVLSSVPWLSSTCPALSTPSTCPHTHQLNRVRVVGTRAGGTLRLVGTTGLERLSGAISSSNPRMH